MPGGQGPGVAYERGTQAFIYTALAASNAQVGLAAPVGAGIFGIVPTVSRGQLPFNGVFQIRAIGGSFTSFSVTILGSLDGVNFFPISAAVTQAAPTNMSVNGGIFTAETSGAVGIDFGVRYISAVVTALVLGTATGLELSFAV